MTLGKQANPVNLGSGFAECHGQTLGKGHRFAECQLSHSAKGHLFAVCRACGTRQTVTSLLCAACMAHDKAFFKKNTSHFKFCRVPRLTHDKGLPRATYGKQCRHAVCPPFTPASVTGALPSVNVGRRQRFAECVGLDSRHSSVCRLLLCRVVFVEGNLQQSVCCVPSGPCKQPESSSGTHGYVDTMGLFRTASQIPP
jgi:hypothetical protein